MKGKVGLTTAGNFAGSDPAGNQSGIAQGHPKQLFQTRLAFKLDTHFAAGLVAGPRVYHVVHDRVLIVVEAQFLLSRAYHLPAGNVVSHRPSSARESILEAVYPLRVELARLRKRSYERLIAGVVLPALSSPFPLQHVY